MDFYETEQGRMLYEHTIPLIAKALQKIAESLTAPAPCIRIAREAPKDFLTELYWGNYDASGEPDTEESAKCSAEIGKAQEAVEKQVTPEVWAQIETVFTLISRRNDLDRAEAYAAGFRAAVTMLAAGLSKPESKEAG